MILRFRPAAEQVGEVATRASRREPEASTIVVGVDGSEESWRALRWAVDEARLRGARVVAVHAWLCPRVGIGAHTVPPGYEELRRDAGETLEDAVRSVEATDPDVAVERRVVEGIPADELIAAAEDTGAALLVLGSRGLGGLAGLLLGSVGRQCLHHALCPVVIVPHGERGTRPARGDGTP